jgi:hypothetical protein
MTRKEKAERDIRLSLGFLKHLLDHPDEVDRIPPGCLVEFLSGGREVPPRCDACPKGTPVLKVRVRWDFRVGVSESDRAA